MPVVNAPARIMICHEQFQIRANTKIRSAGALGFSGNLKLEGG